VAGIFLVRPDRYEAVKKLGQAPSRPLIFQGFRRFRSEPVPFFHSLVMRGGALDKPAPALRLTRLSHCGKIAAVSGERWALAHRFSATFTCQQQGNRWVNAHRSPK
jgi:hypothetical protein